MWVARSYLVLATLRHYNWSAKDDVLANLLDLNLGLAELEAEGQAVAGPWDPNTKP
jgi:hypothetical protein